MIRSRSVDEARLVGNAPPKKALLAAGVSTTSYAQTQAPAQPAPATQPSRAQQLMGDIAPKMAELTDNVLFGDIWERPELSKRDRSIGAAERRHRSRTRRGDHASRLLLRLAQRRLGGRDRPGGVQAEVTPALAPITRRIGGSVCQAKELPCSPQLLHCSPCCSLPHRH